MHIDLQKTLNTLAKHLQADQLYKAYDQILRMRSQIIGVIHDREQFGSGEAPVKKRPVCQTRSTEKQIVMLTIPEPLPAMRELTGALEQHWVDMIHDAIAKEAETGLPYFEKAFVWIEITAPRGTKNPKVWDTSNRAINVIINNLKDIFFWDDNFEHMAFGIEAAWGEPGETRVYIMDAVEARKRLFDL